MPDSENVTMSSHALWVGHAAKYPGGDGFWLAMTDCDVDACDLKIHNNTKHWLSLLLLSVPYNSSKSSQLQDSAAP